MLDLDHVFSQDRSPCAVGARDATFFLEDGFRVLDFASGGLGHGAREVIDAALSQMRLNPLSTRHFLSLPLARLSRLLASACPGDLEVSYLCNSGTEAVEGALKLACGFHRDRRRFVSLRGAYHGSTLGALSVCGVEEARRPFASLPVEVVTAPDVTALPDLVDRETAAVIVEPWPGGAGLPVGEKGWLSALSRRCEESGALLIADEIRTGMGRSGKMFAVEWEEVVPDVLVIGGALGGGFVPLAGYVSSHRVNDRVYARRDPTLHASATGGNPTACAAGDAALRLVTRPGFLRSVEGRARLLRGGLEEISTRHPDLVPSVRSAGLSAWIELADPRRSDLLRKGAWRSGLVLGSGQGHAGATVLLFPPLLVSSSEIRRALQIIASTLNRGCDELVNGR